MAQIRESCCDCCGRVVDLTQVEFCPTCRYPVNPEKEQQFLENSIRDLQRVARYGGSLLRVLDLLRRYEGRLQVLYAFTTLRSAPPPVPAEESAAVSGETPTARASMPPEVTRPRTAPVMPVPLAASAPVTPPAMPVRPAASMRSFSLSGDAMVNVLAAVGGFLVLAGVLGTVFVTTNVWLAFLVVLGVHAAFGCTSLITRRSSLLRAVSPLYTIIFALLVPLVAFSAYRLVENDIVALSVPYLLALSSLYAAVIYAVLAVVQRFAPFAYLGSAALLVGDLALAQAQNLAYWWWPVVAMLLALGALVALPWSSDPDLFAEQRAILRMPLLVLMYTVVGAVALLGPVMLLKSLTLDGLTQNHAAFPEMHVALLILSCLVVLWFALWLWRTRQTKWTPLLAYLILATFLLLGYALSLNLTGYGLLETGVALLYHMLVRVESGQPTGHVFPGRTLDGLAIGLVVLVLLQTALALPLQLFSSPFITPPIAPGARTLRLFFSPFTADASTTPDLFALGMGLLVTFDMTLARAGFSRRPTKKAAGWCWLLLLSGLLLSSFYGMEVLLWNVHPFWAYLAFSLGLLTCAVLTRRLTSHAWSDPLEVLFLLEISFTLLLSLSQLWYVISGLLLGLAGLVYGVALYQRRPYHAFFSAALLLLALLSLQGHLLVILVMSLLLPLLVAGLRRAGLFALPGEGPMSLFAWTLLMPALVFGLVLVMSDTGRGQSVLAYWSGMQMPVSYEIAGLGLAWYAAALLGRERLWLLPATLFWLVAMLQPTNNFWVLSLLTPGLAILGVTIERRASAGWALPFYLLALAGAGMMVYNGFTSGQVQAVSWFLLGYALLAYGIGLVVDQLAAPLLTVLCSTLAVYLAASQLDDLYLPPLVALLGAGAGLVAGRVAPAYGRSGMRYALPLYTSGLAAAVLTGIYGSLGDLSRPFYGAIPDALFLYALVASAVAWIERRASWNWLVAIFACWGVLVTQRLTAWYVLGTGIGLVLIGLLSAQLTPLATSPTAERQSRLASLARTSRRVSWSWSWPWYSAFLVAALVLGIWPTTTGQELATTPVAQGMVVFTLLALLVMLVMRAPELLIFPVALATWSISLWLSTATPTWQVVAYTLLCVLIYIAQFVWRLWPANSYRLSSSTLHHVFSLVGLCLVLLFAAGQGALSTTAGLLAQAGVLALLTLSVLLFLFGLLHPANVALALPMNVAEGVRAARLAQARVVRHWCNYTVGLLISLGISWELLAFGHARFDTLTLAPASYLIVIAPFLLRDQVLPNHRNSGQWVALLGSALLFLPALWFSFQGADLLPTLVLLGEALLLLILGLLLRMRVFILSSAALIIVGTLRLLFISMPPSVPILLLVFGGLLMALATVLILSRHRLQTAWNRWE